MYVYVLVSVLIFIVGKVNLLNILLFVVINEEDGNLSLQNIWFYVLNLFRCRCYDAARRVIVTLSCFPFDAELVSANFVSVLELQILRYIFALLNDTRIEAYHANAMISMK